MHTKETVQKFIALRGSGLAYARIAQELSAAYAVYFTPTFNRAVADNRASNPENRLPGLLFRTAIASAFNQHYQPGFAPHDTLTPLRYQKIRNLLIDRL